MANNSLKLTIRFYSKFIILTYFFQMIFSKRFLSTSESSTSSNQEDILGHHQLYPPGSYEFYRSIIFSVLCTILAGFCSGLTVGYLSIDITTLRIHEKKGTQQQKEQAKKIIPIVTQHHLLLSTLLIANAFAMECLPVFLHQIVPGWLAILISTFFVVIFGEILPQAFCTGPNQLKIAENCVPFMLILECTLYPIAYPTGKILDWVIGEHGEKMYQKKDLKALIEFHESNCPNSFQQQGFNKEEVILLKSLIELREQYVTNKIVPIQDVYMLNTEDIFTRDMIKNIKLSGFSELPIIENIYSQQLELKGSIKIIGVLRTKTILMAQEKHMNKKIGNRFPLTTPLIVAQDTTILEMLQIFQLKKCSMAFISETKVKRQKFQIQEKDGHGSHQEKHEYEQEQFNKKNLILTNQDYQQIIGIICLKDVFEEIIDYELQDQDFHLFYKDQNFVFNFTLLKFYQSQMQGEKKKKKTEIIKNNPNFVDYKDDMDIKESQNRENINNKEQSNEKRGKKTQIEKIINENNDQITQSLFLPLINKN